MSATVYFKRGKYGTLYWDFFLTPAAIDLLGPKVVTDMTYADVNGKPINPPYSPHSEISDYDFHSSMRKYQGLAGFPSGAIKTNDTVTFVWTMLGLDGSGEGAYRNITCIVPQSGVG